MSTLHEHLRDRKAVKKGKFLASHTCFNKNERMTKSELISNIKRKKAKQKKYMIGNNKNTNRNY